MGKNCKEAIFTTRPSNPASCHRHARPYPTLPCKDPHCHCHAKTPHCHCRAKSPLSLPRKAPPLSLPRKAPLCHCHAKSPLSLPCKEPPLSLPSNNLSSIPYKATLSLPRKEPTVIAVLDTAIFLPTYRVTTNKDTFSAKKDPCKSRGLFYRFNKSGA